MVNEQPSQRAERTNMARRRYQRGSLIFANNNWHARYLEDVRQLDGTMKRVHRRVFLGSKIDYPTAKLARRALDQLLAPINNSQYKPRVNITLSEFIAKWQVTAEAQYAPSTWQNHLCAIRRYLLPAFGHQQLNDITTEALQHYIASLTLSPTAARNIISTFKIIWGAADSWGYVQHSPFAKLKLPRKQHIEPRYFSQAQVQLILDSADEPLRSICWLCAQTGLRIGEVLALQWCDFDETNNRLHVHRNMWRGHVRQPKTNAGFRNLQLSPKLSGHLLARRTGSQELMFAGLDADSLRRYRLQPLLAKLGLPDAGFHAFRHTNASILDHINAPMKLRQQRLGHTDAALTVGLYTHVNDADSQLVANKFDELFAFDCPVNSEVAESKGQ